MSAIIEMGIGQMSMNNNPTPVEPSLDTLPGYKTPIVSPAPTAAPKTQPEVWWVRSSDKQLTSKSDLPLGFKHTLLRGKKAFTSGIGTDAGRTLRAQAVFLNERVRRDEKIQNTPVTDHGQTPGVKFDHLADNHRLTLSSTEPNLMEHVSEKLSKTTPQQPTH